jgi:hypothetical protein
MFIYFPGYLTLTSNQLTGPVPSELGQLQTLSDLRLGTNYGLTGVLPSAICAIPNLDEIQVMEQTGVDCGECTKCL